MVLNIRNLWGKSGLDLEKARLACLGLCSGGLWTSLDLFEAFELQGLRRGFHRTFLAQAMPALLALLLVLYAPVLQGLAPGRSRGVEQT